MVVPGAHRPLGKQSELCALKWDREDRVKFTVIVCALRELGR